MAVCPGPQCGTCPGPCGANPIKVCCINTCNGGQPATGVTVQIYSGDTLVATCTTDSTGCCTFPDLPPGSYTVTTTTDNPRYQSSSTSANLTCGGTLGITLSPAENYFCSPCFNEPIPIHLVANIDGTLFNFIGNSPANLYPSASFLNTINPAGGTVFCPPDPSPNPCTMGGIAYALISFDSSGSCTVSQYWCQATDCTQVVSDECPSTPFDYIAGEGIFSDGSGAGSCANVGAPFPQPQWNEGTCEGFCLNGADASASIGTGNPVPVNVILTFTSSAGSPSPPFPTMQITE